MRKLTSAALATLLAIICATTAASAGDRILARGEFTATVDFSTLKLTPVDENCLLEVEGVIAFTGTLDMDGVLAELLIGLPQFAVAPVLVGQFPVLVRRILALLKARELLVFVDV